jgi:membrane-bound inhibitor of C-type lysozyme
MKIKLSEVTRFSQTIAIVLFVAVYFLGFCLGRSYEKQFIIGDLIESVELTCRDDKSIKASIYTNFAHIELGSEKALYLPQTISASGIRYANSDESLVFWIKGDNAFVTEGDLNNPTYQDCVIAPE